MDRSAMNRLIDLLKGEENDDSPLSIDLNNEAEGDDQYSTLSIRSFLLRQWKPTLHALHWEMDGN